MGEKCRCAPMKGRRGTDFGQGFYLTPDMDSARSMASLVTRRQGDGIKTISVFEFDIDAASIAGMAIRQFESKHDPSGDPTPSKADYDTTARLNDGANLVGLELIDHLIIGAPESENGRGFVSMAELMAG